MGSPRLELDGQPLKVETRKTIALLAFLGMTGESYRRDSLVNLLWPDYDLTHGRGVLRRTLSALNAALPEGWVRADRETIGLGPASRLWLDVRVFQNLLAERHAHPHPAAAVCPDCLRPLTEAAALYRADFMSGFSLPDSFNFDDWQFFQAEGLRQELGDALAKLVRCQVLRADFSAALEAARRRLALDRLNEEAHRDLMQLYAWTGQRSAALRQYQECKEELSAQLAVDPQPATQDLARALETGQLPGPPIDPAWQPLRDQPAAPVSPLVRTDRPPGDQKRILSFLACEIAAQAETDPAEAGFAEEGSALQDRFQALAAPVVKLYGGRITRSLGSSALVVFGLDHSRENDPELVLRTALDLRERCEQSGLLLSAGVACGEMHLRAAADGFIEPLRLAGPALDQALFLAARAPCGQVLASESAYQICRRTFEFVVLPPQVLRSGSSLPAYRVEGLLRAPRSASGSEALRAKLVGRDSELAHLSSLLKGLSAGQGFLLALVGEAGVGKSRLVEELRAGGQPARLFWLEGRCLELSIDTGYWPFIDLLKQYFAWQAHSPDNARLVAESIRSLSAQGFLEPRRAEELVPVFLRLLAFGSPANPAGQAEPPVPEELRQQTFLALRDFLVALSRRQPLALVFEDLHWADRLSLDLLSLLMEALERSPLGVFCVYRPGQDYRTAHLPALAARKCPGRFSELNINELNHTQCGHLVEGLLGNGVLAESFKELVWERCQGNPYFVRETLQSLVDGGILYREGQEWKTKSDLNAALLPASLQSTLLARLDHLSEDWRLVLQVAAVLGRVFRRCVLEHALRGEADLEKALWELEDRGLIYQERAVPEIEYSFHHALLQEAIYHNILRHRRKALHQRAAEAIEALYPGRLTEQAEQLAYHDERCGDIRSAIHYLYLAGEKARAGYSNEASIRHLTKGLELLRSLPESLDRNRQELEFLILMGVPMVHSRGHADPSVLMAYQDARDLCLKIGDSAHLFEALLGLRRYALYHGHIQTALELSRQMLDLSETQGDSYGQARACMMLAEVFFRQGQVPQTMQLARRGLALSAPLDPLTTILRYGNDTGVGNEVFLTLTLWHAGQVEQARQQAQRQLAHSAALDHPFTHELNLYLSAHFYTLLRDPASVQRLAEEELRIASERSYALYQAWGAAQFGWALALQGQVEAGLNWMRQGMDGMGRMKFGLIQESLYPFLSEILLLSGQTEQALECIVSGLQAVDRSGAAEALPELHRLKGLALQRQNRPQEAEKSYLYALQTARGACSRGFELRSALEMARLWLLQGRRAEARGLLEPLYAAYSEGLDTPDLVDARKLLERIA